MPRRARYILVTAVAAVALVITTVAAAWLSTSLVAPGPPRAETAPEPATVTDKDGSPRNPSKVTPRAAAQRLPTQSGNEPNVNLAAAQVPMEPAAALPAPLRKPEVEEVLFIPVPKPGEGPVFSVNDQGLSAPVLLSPRLNALLQPNESRESLCAIDLVISGEGNVESVKLASPARDYREAMLLSAVKAWRFRPASIDGMQVRYQMRIHVGVNSVAAGNR